MVVRFVFLAEGSSDGGLVPHLERMCIAAGAHEVSGVSPDFNRLPSVGRTVQSKLTAALELEPHADLIFVHRDSDSRTSSQRYEEIAEAVRGSGASQQVVAVVPVQETEAWLLVDEAAIRRAVGNPHGTVDLRLPNPGRVENVASPKEVLEDALVRASEQSGRRLRRLRKGLPSTIRDLLSDLPLEGPVARIPSWNRLRGDTRDALATLAQERAGA